jgi:hypothetical protein
MSSSLDRVLGPAEPAAWRRRHRERAERRPSLQDQARSDLDLLRGLGHVPLPEDNYPSRPGPDPHSLRPLSPRVVKRLAATALAQREPLAAFVFALLRERLSVAIGEAVAAAVSAALPAER